MLPVEDDMDFSGMDFSNFTSNVYQLGLYAQYLLSSSLAHNLASANKSAKIGEVEKKRSFIFHMLKAALSLFVVRFLCYDLLSSHVPRCDLISAEDDGEPGESKKETTEDEGPAVRAEGEAKVKSVVVVHSLSLNVASLRQYYTQPFCL
ncbi:hypothetical protein ACLOJK_028926 [Asimina triloba]